MTGDDTSRLMSFHDQAIELAREFPAHKITVEGGRRGLRFIVEAKDPRAPGPALLITGSAAEVRGELGGDGAA